MLRLHQWTSTDPVALKKHLTATFLQVHARIEFQLLEGALLALAAFNGVDVKGHTIKVRLSPSAVLVILIHSSLVPPGFLCRSRDLSVSPRWTWT